MKLAQNRFKHAIAAGEKQVGMWSTLCSPIVAETLSYSGLDWVLIDTELDSLVPFFSTEGGTEPVFNWKNTISLRLVSFASVAYVVKLDYNRQLSEYLQFEQRVLLRFTFDIL